MAGSNKVSRNTLPGFGLSLGYSVFYLSLLVLIPISMLAVTASSLGISQFWQIISHPRVVQSYWLSLYTAFISSAVNVVLGVLIAWVLTRYEFPGKKILDAIVDIPFALPTAVAGISLSTLFAPSGWLGYYLEKADIHVINAPPGIIAALIFIGFPFVVRTVQPVLQEVEPEAEEAAMSLGANRLQIFFKVIFPPLIPSIITGFTLAFARCIGEYGSVIFIAGNLPYKTEITPLLIMSKLDGFDYAGASAIAATLLFISFIILLSLNLIQRHQSLKLTGR